MRAARILKSEKGVSTILIVMAVSAVLATFILTLQMYVSSRARVVARVRLAYKYTFIMEDAAKMVLLSRNEYFQGVVSGTGCTGTRGPNPIATGAGNPANINICMDDTTMSNRCINDQSCICEFGETDNACANHTFLEKKLWKSPLDRFNESGDEIIAFEHDIKDPDLTPAFDQSIFESLLPNFDNRFLAFVDRVLDREPNKNVSFLNEATAAANASYGYTIPNPNIFAPGNGAPAAGTTATTSPYPAAGDAFTFRNCGANRCVEIRVCVREANEQSLKTGSGQICFYQKISRSFLWPHATAPCDVADDDLLAAGTACTNPVNNDIPVAPREKGYFGCQECPWRDRF